MKIRLTNDAKFILVQMDGYLALGELDTFLNNLAEHEDCSTMEKDGKQWYFVKDKNNGLTFGVPESSIDSAELEADMNMFFQGNKRAMAILRQALEINDTTPKVPKYEA